MRVWKQQVISGGLASVNILINIDNGSSAEILKNDVRVL